MEVYTWEWHDFESESNSTNEDEFDQYSFPNGDEIAKTVIRQFWVGSMRNGHMFSIIFEKN